ncbi:MAG: GNAT family N-acetyltransferase [Propionibacteriaceae bacterium]|nr:GNAT family N-acetyltransferase [Propionibacteriaceae bacterium]
MTRRTAVDVVADDTGVVLRDAVSGAWFLAAETAARASDLLSAVHDVSHIIVHQAAALPLVAERFGCTRQTSCRQSVFFGPDIAVRPAPGVTLAPLGPEWAPVVAETYSLGLGLDWALDRLAAGVMVGAFAEGQLAGFAGEHPEGSMGALEVLPGFRRRGIAEHLTTFIAHRMLADGRTPFDQIIDGNTASAALQRKLGFSISTHHLWWTSRPGRRG